MAKSNSKTKMSTIMEHGTKITKDEDKVGAFNKSKMNLIIAPNFKFIKEDGRIVYIMDLGI